MLGAYTYIHKHKNKQTEIKPSLEEEKCKPSLMICYDIRDQLTGQTEHEGGQERSHPAGELILELNWKNMEKLA